MGRARAGPGASSTSRSGLGVSGPADAWDSGCGPGEGQGGRQGKGWEEGPGYVHSAGARDRARAREHSIRLGGGGGGVGAPFLGPPLLRLLLHQEQGCSEGGGKGFVTPTEKNVHGDALCFMVKTWARHKTIGTVLNNGRLLVAVGVWWLPAVVGGWWLAVVGGWWLAVVGGWRLALWGCP